jgi:hypothetical protein
LIRVTTRVPHDHPDGSASEKRSVSFSKAEFGTRRPQQFELHHKIQMKLGNRLQIFTIPQCDDSEDTTTNPRYYANDILVTSDSGKESNANVICGHAIILQNDAKHLVANATLDAVRQS